MLSPDVQHQHFVSVEIQNNEQPSTIVLDHCRLSDSHFEVTCYSFADEMRDYWHKHQQAICEALSHKTRQTVQLDIYQPDIDHHGITRAG